MAIEHRNTSCETFGDTLHEREFLRASQQVEAIAITLLVDGIFDVAQQARRVLHLVDDRWRGVPAQKLSTGFFGFLGLIGRSSET